jgi:RimJ/RimL family protein N-acetyltransferase
MALNDSNVMKFTEARFTHWGYLSAFRFACRANRSGDSIQASVLIKETNQWIGNVRIFNWHPHHRTAELSFLFFDQSHWNKGYATEAVSALIEFAADNLGVRKIYGDFYEPNLFSGKLFIKLGFEVEGRSKAHFLINELPVDSVLVGKILSDETI